LARASLLILIAVAAVVLASREEEEGKNPDDDWEQLSFSEQLERMKAKQQEKGIRLMLDADFVERTKDMLKDAEMGGFLAKYLETKDQDGMTPFQKAMEENSIEEMNLILAASVKSGMLGAVLKTKDQEGDPPLLDATYPSDADKMKLFLYYAGKDPYLLREVLEAKSDLGMTALHRAASHPGEPFKLLVEASEKAGMLRAALHGMNPDGNAAAVYGFGVDTFFGRALDAPLVFAAQDGKAQATKTLLDAYEKAGMLGEALKVKSSRGNTPLHFAAEFGHAEVAKMLLNAAKKAGGKLSREALEAENNKGMTPLDSAAGIAKLHSDPARKAKSEEVAKLLRDAAHQHGGPSTDTIAKLRRDIAARRANGEFEKK